MLLVYVIAAYLFSKVFLIVFGVPVVSVGHSGCALIVTRTI